MKYTKILTAGALVILFLSGIVLLKNLFIPKYSANILYLTQSVASFSGYVEKIDNNVLTLSQKRDFTQNMIKEPYATPPADAVKTVIYKVIITNKTSFRRLDTQIPLFYSEITPAPLPAPTFKDIKVGQYISADTNIDLRTLTKNEFEAISINLPQIYHSVTGKVLEISSNNLRLQQTADIYVPPIGLPSDVNKQYKEYTVSFNSDVEVSQFNTVKLTKSERLPLSSIKEGMTVTVYSLEDVTGTQNLTALRIEPITDIPPD